MRSPLLALASMMWRQHRTTHFIMLALLALCAVAYPALNWLRPVTAWQLSFINELPFTVIPMGVALLWALMVATFSEADPRRGFSGLPSWMFALPLRTERLVGRVMFLGVMLVVATYLVWARVVFPLVGVQMDIGWPLFVFAAATLAFQAATWGLASFPWIRGFVIAGVLFLLCYLLFLPHAMPAHFADNHSRYVLAVIATAVTALVGGILGVRGERTGGWNPWTPVRRALHGVYDAVWGTRKKFSTPERALRWFDWRRRGWLFTLGFAGVAAGSVVLFPVTAILEGQARVAAGAIIGVAMWPLLVAGTTGVAFGRSDFGGSVELPPFHGAKPVTTATMVLVRMRVLAECLLGGYALSVPLAALIFRWPNWRELWLNDDLMKLWRWLPEDAATRWLLLGLCAAAMFAATWHTAISGLAIGLTGRLRRINIQIFAGMFLFFAVVGWLLWLYQHPARWDAAARWMYPVLAAVLAWKAAAAARAFSALRKAALTSRHQFLVLSVLWGVIALVLAAAALAVVKLLGIPAWLTLGALAFLMPGGEMPRAILHLDSNRHR